MSLWRRKAAMDPDKTPAKVPTFEELQAQVHQGEIERTEPTGEILMPDHQVPDPDRGLGDDEDGGDLVDRFQSAFMAGVAPERTNVDESILRQLKARDEGRDPRARALPAGETPPSNPVQTPSRMGPDNLPTNLAQPNSTNLSEYRAKGGKTKVSAHGMVMAVKGEDGTWRVPTRKTIEVTAERPPAIGSTPVPDDSPEIIDAEEVPLDDDNSDTI